MATNSKKKRTTAQKTTGKSTSGSRSKTSGRAASSAARETARRKSPESENTNPMIMQEAALWLVLAVCILIFISYLGLGGYLGGVISDVSFGIFGIAAYLFPFLIFVAAAFFISNRGSHVGAIKILSVAGLYLCICSFAELFSFEETARDVASMYNVGAASKTGGGVIGGLACSVLRPALGDIGSFIILAILLIVFLVLVTQRSLMRGMKKQSSRMYQSAKESSARRRKAYEARRARRLEEENARLDAESADGASALELPAARENFAVRDEVLTGKRGRKQRPAAQETIPSSSSAAGSLRTEIDIPVHFPAQPRAEHIPKRVSGVTMDTKIRGDSEKIGAEIHEIMPKRTAKQPEDGFLTGSPSRNTSFISLDQTGREEQTEKISGLEIYNAELQIDGIETQPSDDIPESRPSEDEAAAFDFSGNFSGKSTPASQMEGGDRDSGAREDASADETEHSAGGSQKRNPRSSRKEIAAGIASVEAEAAKAAEAVRPEYIYPPLKLLKKGAGRSGAGQDREVRKTAAKLQQTLESFGVHATVTNVSCGPAVTRYELLPEQGVKVSRIVGLSDDIKLNLAAADIRIEAPIPGKAAVGIEVPNSENSAVALRDLLESDAFKNHPSKLAFATGKDISGKVVVADIAKMPHLLIAGATGSGKSVCINTLIMSILYKASPDEVKLIMVDPKVVELNVYNGIPHLMIPVVTDPKKAAGALNWAVAEMMNRYEKFAEVGVRDLKGYNKKVEGLEAVDDENKPRKLPQIVIIVDELADLMLVAPGEVEDAICRLAQLARACGIHLVIATQRPSVNVITGLIKANMPSRIAFSVTSGVDSRTILDMGGAEKLLGKGDMLFYPQGYQKPARVQGAFVSDEEVADVVDFLKNQNVDVKYNADIEEQIAKVQSAVAASKGESDVDALFADAGKFIIEKDKASIGMLQRVFKIGFNRAARIMDQLSNAGVVGPEEGTKPRKILMSAEQFENYLEQN